MADDGQVNEVQEKLDELAGQARDPCVLSRLEGACLMCDKLSLHAVDDGELTLDLGKKKKKKKKEAAEPAVSCRVKWQLQLMCATLL